MPATFTRINRLRPTTDYEWYHWLIRRRMVATYFMQFRRLVSLACGCLLLLALIGRLRREMMTSRHALTFDEVCKNQKRRDDVSLSKMVLDSILVSDQHKILFCETPQAGDTEWKKLLIAASGAYPSVEDIPENLIHDHKNNGWPRLSSLTPQEITHRLNTYFKFIIVRDPFERLITTFEDKFLFRKHTEPWYQHTIAPAIIHRYRKYFPFLADTGLTFDEFVRYLGDVDARETIDWQFGRNIVHWATYADLCAPCDVRYDAIGRYETLERDATQILRKAGIECVASSPLIDPGITRDNKTKAERYFAGISKQDIRRLYERYEVDFQLFGYPTPDFLLN
ncbi:carbohydrate sulfotransferase 10-like isoform X2 [Entelurus aequoreus]|uniref:carbohydrate sulfotransferase 10-like isoform X2 n=2 Tax=Entelurus aequoreus TaxID=161455 RepID=UPI002B1DB108|nr:carbohydrate sulfotransferase 10-like isoform X2 [Entelurus aequoreus]